MAVWKWVLGYAVVRSATRPDPPRREPAASGYASFIAVAVLMAVPGVLWLLLVAGHPVLTVGGAVWLLVAACVGVGGCAARYKDRTAAR